MTDLRLLLAAKKDERYHREYMAVSQRMLITILCGFARKRSCPLPEYEPPSRKETDDLMADRRSADDIKSDFMTKLNKLKKGAAE